ncbi:MAG: glycerol kinase GlpK [Acidobacteria bacterium]|jgi:glycerol kinase|nr:glycerol kinase GlpK [Acidobacteriota bacterium]
MSYILALDQGTTSSRSIIFDKYSQIISVAQKEHTQIFPKSGWVEHNPFQIWEAQRDTAIEALQKANLSAADIAAIGITNQRETTVVWSRKTGEPVCNAVVWQDRRTSVFCDEVRKDYGDLIRRKTGLETDAYFSASKLNWILENVEGARKKAENDELLFGTIDTWLVWKFTNGEKHLTDVSNASRTMLFNIETLRWDEELLEIFNVPRQILPEVHSSSEIYGEVKTPDELAGIKITGIAGDQQAALFGQRCFKKGLSKSTYGTGCFLLQNTGTEIKKSENKLLTTIAWQIGRKTEYALEGSVFIGGAVVGWLRDSLQIIEDSADVEALANLVEDTGGVYFVPAFAGLGAPHWNQDARGLIIGLTGGTNKAHIARAAVESICYQTADLLDALQGDSKIKLKELRVDGGASRNNSLLQFQADVLQIPVVRSRITETTALGAAYMAGLAIGFWESTDELASHQTGGKVFNPQMPETKAKELRRRWSEAVKRAINWEV